MIQFIKRLFLTGLTEEEYKDISEKIQKSNRKNLITFSKITVLVLCVMIIVALCNPVARLNMIPYGISLIIMIGILLYSKYVQKNILPVVYIFSGVILMFGIIIGTITNPENAAGCYMALLLAVPMIFVDKPVRSILMIFISDAVFIPMVIWLKPQSTWSNDLINCVIFGFISMIMSSYMMKIKMSEFRNEKLISKLANVDTMTGLLNRNCFERQVEKYCISDAKDCYCVYVDANGLHELNNTKGHESGDKMLAFVGATLQQLYDDADAYRMGGDEFLVCGTGKTENELVMIMEEVNKKIHQSGYSISAGIECKHNGPFHMDSMVKCAETKMLQNKQKHYESSGADGRAVR